jgi:hypothetical protein
LSRLRFTQFSKLDPTTPREKRSTSAKSALAGRPSAGCNAHQYVPKVKALPTAWRITSGQKVAYTYASVIATAPDATEISNGAPAISAKRSARWASEIGTDATEESTTSAQAAIHGAATLGSW